MHNQKTSFKVLSFICLFSSLLVSACLAAPKTATVQETIKILGQTKKNEVKSSTSQEAAKAPEQIPNTEVKLPIPQRIADAYREIIKSQSLLIIVEKSEYKLYLFKDGREFKSYDIAIGKNPGQKQKVGDWTTPIGEFKVDEMIDSSEWTHDFKDGNGEIEEAYGPWFISLETEWDGIGIHGTHDPSSIGSMVSEGCIRMNNEEVAELKTLISVGVKVIIIESLI